MIFRYAPGDAEIDCSELVFKAFEDAIGLELGVWEELGTLNWKPFEPTIRKLEGGAVPTNRPLITPVGILRSNLISRIYPDNLGNGTVVPSQPGRAR